MLTKQKRWNKSHVGMIHRSSYWGTYALILDVNIERGEITELDKFGGINRGKGQVRKHGTQLDEDDVFFTVSEYFELLKSGEVLSLNVNNEINTWK